MAAKTGEIKMDENKEHKTEAKKHKENLMRKKIMKKGFDLIAKKGLNDFSMRELAESLNVTKPVIYYYFKNREDLCKSIVEDQGCRFKEYAEKKYNENVPLDEILAEWLNMYLKYLLDDSKNVAFIFHLMSFAIKKENHKRSTYLKDKKEHKDKMNAKLKELEKAGRLPKGAAEDLLHMLSALMAHYTMNAPLQFGFEFSEELSRRLTKIVLLGVKEYYKVK